VREAAMKLSEEGLEIARRLGAELDREHVNLIGRLLGEQMEASSDLLDVALVSTKLMSVMWDEVEEAERRRMRP
jgi:hypothetical protein